MALPFTPDQFFEIFADYNRALWLGVAALWIVSLGMLVMAWWHPRRRSRALTYFLGALWGWNAVAYHAWFFTRINPAAWVFASLFAFQAALLLWTATRKNLEYFSSPEPMLGLGVGLAFYSLVYPFLNAIGHDYPATPTFGVPCPTDILTIGLLLTVRGGVPVILAIIPALWAFIGGSAAVLVSVTTDYVLLGAGVALIVGSLTTDRVLWRTRLP